MCSAGFLQLCPANACTYDLEVHDALWDLTVDLAVVYSHVIAPDSLATRLPPIVGDWRGFATRRRLREVEGERRRNDRASEYDRFPPDDHFRNAVGSCISCTR